MTERLCPTCHGDGTIEVDDEDLDEDVDEDTGELVVRMVPTVRDVPCPICGGSGSVEA